VAGEIGSAVVAEVDVSDESSIVRMVARYPMPRLCAPEDVANAVLFLASDEAAYINATTLMVDGGATVYMTNTQSGGKDAG
jgi:NAD(P)-dependent dehydrogenase (short-subunit alcohol dehydrogenase family)